MLVLGATGDVEPHVVSELAALGERPRMPVRDVVRARTTLGDEAADHFREMYELFKAGDSEFVPDLVREATRAGPRTAEAFLDQVLLPRAVWA